RPESSARAGNPVTRAAWRALSSAFSTNVSPVSSTSSTPSSPCGTSCTALPSSNARSSASLPALALARTRRGAGWSGTAGSGAQRSALGVEQLPDALVGQPQQGVQFLAAERVAFGGALQLDEATAV